MIDSRRGFFRRIRIRMRVSWLASSAAAVAPMVAVIILGLFVADWLTRWDNALSASLWILAIAVVSLLTGAASVRVSEWDAARAAERGLKARDAFTTAREFDDPENDLHGVIQSEADQMHHDALLTQFPCSLHRVSAAAFDAVGYQDQRTITLQRTKVMRRLIEGECDRSLTERP